MEAPATRSVSSALPRVLVNKRNKIIAAFRVRENAAPLKLIKPRLDFIRSQITFRVRENGQSLTTESSSHFSGKSPKL
jgi:hypothetical protein